MINFDYLKNVNINLSFTHTIRNNSHENHLFYKGAHSMLPYLYTKDSSEFYWHVWLNSLLANIRPFIGAKRPSFIFLPVGKAPCVSCTQGVFPAQKQVM